MKYIHVLLLLIPFVGFTQKEGDKTIIIKSKKTDSLYWHVKYALGKCDYIVREDGNRDTLRTFATKSPFIDGFTVVIAVINEGRVKLSGYYGLSQFDGWFFTHQPNQYKHILYFDNSKAWKQLMYIVSKLDYTEINFFK
jgi:hypothetical protein